MPNKYYTPELVADLLISRIPAMKPRFIADICAGSGNLLWAAHQKWPKAKILAVDIDTSMGKHWMAKKAIFWKIADGREAVFEKQLIGQCDVVLANPPFTKCDTPPPKELDDMVRPLKIAYRRIINRLDASMIFANLAALAPNGYLGLILPDGFLNALCWRTLREFILKNYRIMEIISLPDVFKKAEVKSSIIVIKKEPPAKYKWTKISIACFSDRCLRIIMSKNIVCGLLSERMDAKYFFNEEIKRIEGKELLNNLPVTIKRGAYSSSKIVKDGKIRIIHSSNVNLDNKINAISFFLDQKELAKGIKVKTKIGDIVFVRVGKTLGRLGIISKKEQGAIISDCLFRIRLSNDYPSEPLFDYLVSNEAQEYFNHISRGTGASYVTKEDLFYLPIPCEIFKYYNDK